MSDRNAWAEGLLGLRDFVGDPPRWGGEVAVAAQAADPPNTLLGVPVQQLASVMLPAPFPVTVRWGYWKPAPFSIPGLPLPVGGGGRFRPDTSTGGITHHDAFRILMEWGIPGTNGVQMRQWIGPNANVTIGAQQMTLRLFRMRRTTLNVVVKAFITLGEHSSILDTKCVNSTHTVPGGVDPNWTELVGSNWARRGGYVSLINPVGVAPLDRAFIAFSEFAPSGGPADGIMMRFEDAVATPGSRAPQSVPIPVDWCGPIWGIGADDPPNAEFSITEHWVSPPEMNPWAATP